MTAVEAPARITEPGVYSIPVAHYHLDPVPGGSLSSTGARKLLPPSCPALFQHWRDNPPERKREFDLGHAAHRVILGAGEEIEIIEAENYRTKAAQDAKRIAYDEGRIPVLPHEYDDVRAMSGALFAHPFAGKLFEPGTGEPEQTVVWQDAATGVWCRALLDWLPHPTAGRLLFRDYKTAAEGRAAPERIGKSMASFGYYIQLAFHLAGAQTVGLAGDDAQALLVVQERTPPFLVTVARPDRDAMVLGARRMREALELYATCMASGRWPGYADDVVDVELPPWETKELREDIW